MNKILALIFFWTGLNKVFLFLNRNRKIILSYHNVINDSYFDDSLHLGVSTSKSVFIKQLEYLIKNYKINNNLKDPKSITLTFDDGYHNQYMAIADHLVTRNIKCFLFCQSSFLSEPETALTDKLLCWLSYCEPTTINVPTKKIQIRIIIDSKESRSKAWKVLFPLLISKELSPKGLLILMEKEEKFESIISKIDPSYYYSRFEPITKEQIVSLKANSIKIGPHSVNHDILSSLSQQQIEQQLTEIRNFNDIYNCKVFCYPFGGLQEVNKPVTELLERSEYKFALANINFPTGEFNNWFVPRMSLPNTAEKHILAFELSGAKYFLKYFKLLPKW